MGAGLFVKLRIYLRDWAGSRMVRFGGDFVACERSVPQSYTYG